MDEIDIEPTTTNVSVIVTCHNLEAYLNECVQSLWSQTVQPKEVIIIHDKCDKPMAFDGTTTVIRDGNIGVAKSRDEGVRLSTQPNLLFVDADDVLPEFFLQEMVATLQHGADVAYPDVLVWARWGESVYHNAWYNPPKRLTMRHMIVKNQVVVTSLMRRKVYEAVGGFDPELPIFEDYAFWMAAMKQGFVFKKANTYLKYRQRTESRNRQSDSLKKQIYEQIKNLYAAK